MPTSSELDRCGACGGFAPAGRTACLHCDAPLSRLGQLGRVLATIAGGGMFMVTLMACYGRPHQKGCDGVNEDGDYSCLPEDCNDKDSTVHPGTQDLEGDGVDKNCDGVDGYKPAP